MIIRGLTAQWFTPSEGGASYKIAPLTGVLYLDVFAASEGDVFKLSGKICETIIRSGLVDWKDQMDQEGNPVEFSLDLIPYLSPEDLSAVAAEILSISSLKEAEAKNS